MKRHAKVTPKDKSTSGIKTPLPGKSSLSVPLWPGLAAFLLGFLLYSNTLSHQYALDDYSVILENRVTRQGWEALPEIFTTSYRFGYYFTDDDLYRPLPKAMFAMEWGLFGENPMPGHFINVLLFALTGLVLFRLLFRITGSNLWLAFSGTLLFMAHPIHTEVVANIKSRDEILGLLFCLLALGQFLFGKRDTLAFVVAGSLYLLALLSKESSITFLAVFPLAAWMFGNAEKPIRHTAYLPVVIAAGLFLMIRSSVLEGSETGTVSVADNLLMAADSASEKFATAVLILGYYLKLLLLPHPLAFDYSYNQIPVIGPGNLGFIASFIAYCAIFVASILAARKKHILGFAGLFYLITLSVYSNIFITIGSSMGERFLYMPSLGFCLAAGWVISRFTGSENMKGMPAGLKQLKPAGMAIFVIMMAGYSVKTIARNPVWKNNGTLYENDVLISPNSTRTHYYLGNYLVKPEAWEGKNENDKKAVLERGIFELRRSVEIYSGFSDAHLQMGVAYDKLGQSDSAFACYNRALALSPGNATIHNNIGTLYFKANDFPAALKSFLKAVELDPRYAEAHANAGSAYGMMQQYDNALSSLFQAVKWDPGYAQAYYFIGITYRLKGDEANANAYLAKAKSLNPEIK